MLHANKQEPPTGSFAPITPSQIPGLYQLCVSAPSMEIGGETRDRWWWPGAMVYAMARRR